MKITSYEVQRGDTLSGIALKLYGDPTAYAALAAFNNIRDPNLIQMGQVLELPRPINDPSHVMLPVEPTQAHLDAINALFSPGFCDGQIERQIYAAIVGVQTK